MPYSDARNKPWVLERLREMRPLEQYRKVTDVGAGAGANLEFYWPWMPQSEWTAIEAWQPYVDRFELYRYKYVIVSDVMALRLQPADIIILGDVLEHLEYDAALVLWQRCLAVSPVVVLNLPIIHYEQGAMFGNPYETHRYHWSADQVLQELPSIKWHTLNDVTGAFVAVQ